MATFVFPNGSEIGNIKLVMLDKDGTIFDIHHYWCSMISLRSIHLINFFFSVKTNKQKQELVTNLESVMGIDHKAKKLSKDGPVGIKPRSYIVQVVFDFLSSNGASTTTEEVEKEFKKIDKVSIDRIADFLVILPGVEDFLKSCVDNGVKLTIATTDIKSRAELALTTKGLRQYFDCVVGGDCVENTKPAKDMGLKIVRDMKVLPENAVMIGDHVVDLVMAKNAKLLSGIGVTTGLSLESNLLEISQYVVENLGQIRILNEK